MSRRDLKSSSIASVVAASVVCGAASSVVSEATVSVVNGAAAVIGGAAAGLCGGRGGGLHEEVGRTCGPGLCLLWSCTQGVWAEPLCQLTGPRPPALPAAWRTLSSPGPELP